MDIESIVRRYDVLASKIFCASYASKFGKYDSENKKYNMSKVQKGDFTEFNYFNAVTGKYFDINMDADLKVRDALKDCVISKPGSFCKLEDLLDNTAFVHGNKTHILRNICLSLFDDDSMPMDYKAKEVMNFIEAASNGKITFTDSGDSNKIYINPGTFNTVFYQAKKEKRRDFSNYNNLITLSNDLVTQRGVAESEKKKLKYDSLENESFKTLFVKPGTASKYEPFNSLKKYDSLKHDDLESNIQDVIPKRTFKKIIDNAKEAEYKDLLTQNQSNSELLRKIVTENQESLIFDPFGSLKYQMSSNIVGLVFSIGGTMQNLLDSNDPNVTTAINGAILEELVNASNPHTPLTMKNLKTIISSDEGIISSFTDKFNGFVATLSQQ